MGKARRLPKEIEQALDETGLEWSVEAGGKHQKIRLAGRLVGVIGKSGSAAISHFAAPNTIANIRRMARELRDAGK